MSVLFRQPHGFEGFPAVAEDADTPDLAAREVVDVGTGRLVGDRESTRPSGRADAHGGEDLVGGDLLQPLDLQPKSGAVSAMSVQNL